MKAAIHIRSLLEKNKLSVFQDVESIRSGDRWMSEIESALDRCSAFIVLIGEDGIRRWVGAEVQIALNRNLSPQQDSDRLQIFPIVLPEASNQLLPPFLSLFQVCEWEPSEALPQSLLDSIIHRVENYSDNKLVDGNPYLGLSVFQRKHAHLFFGRQRETLDALNLLGDPRHSNPENPARNVGFRRWLQVEGNSGSGKSSFVNAGLLPLIENNVLWGQTGYETWSVIGSMMPGEKPLETLAELLARKFRHQSMNDWFKQLCSDENCVRYALREQKDYSDAFMLIVDQLEEMLTISNEGQRSVFDIQVSNALGDSNCPFFLVSTIRSDFLADLDKLPSLSMHYNTICGRYRLGDITTEGLREIIEEPARLSGMDASEVVAAILRDAHDEPGALPLVENALDYLWRNSRGGVLDGELYRESGGIAGLLENQADALLDSLDRKQRAGALELLLRLTHINIDGRNTRQRVSLDEAREIAGLGDLEAGRNLIDLLAGRREESPGKSSSGLRLITVSQDDGDGESYLDLIHETLIRSRGKDPKSGQLVGYWNTLYSYIEENRDRDVWRQQLRFQAMNWKDSLWIKRWWHLAGIRDLNRFKMLRPADDSLENSYLTWSKRKIWATSLLTLVFFSYLAQSFYWVLKNELPISSFLELQKFRVGFAPLPELVPVRTTDFMMGELDEIFQDSLPATNHKNFGIPARKMPPLNPYNIGMFEVTYEEYDYYVWSLKKAGNDRIGNYQIDFPATALGGRGKRPVVFVSWNEAMYYAEWLGNKKNTLCRLPLETEWEYAAKAGRETGYPWGNSVELQRATCGNCGNPWDKRKTSRVGRFDPNDFGLYDMNGNVWEWTLTNWGGSLENIISKELPKVIRGGSYFEDAPSSRSTARYSADPTAHYYHVGFRVVCF